MSAYELAKRYYPKLWDKERLKKLVEANKLTQATYEEIIEQAKNED